MPLYEVELVEDEATTSLIFDDAYNVLLKNKYIRVSHLHEKVKVNLSIEQPQPDENIFDLLPRRTLSDTINMPEGVFYREHKARVAYCCGALVCVDWDYDEAEFITCPNCGSVLYRSLNHDQLRVIKSKTYENEGGSARICTSVSSWIEDAIKKMNGLIFSGYTSRVGGCGGMFITNPLKSNCVINMELEGTRFRAYANYLELKERYGFDVVDTVFNCDHFDPKHFTNDDIAEIITEYKLKNNVTENNELPLLFNAAERLDGIRRQYLSKRRPVIKRVFDYNNELGEDVTNEEVVNFCRWLWSKANLLPEITVSGVNWSGYSLNMAVSYEDACKNCQLKIKEDAWNREME